jgi:hypothetical protein
MKRPRSPFAILLHWLYWSPVALAMVVFAQVALQGLRPALSERRRLLEEEGRMEARYRGGMQTREHLADLLRAQRDPVYLERERRLLLLGDRRLLGR